MAQDFPVAPLSRLAWLVLVLPAAIIIGLLLSGQQATPLPLWLPFFIALLIVGLVLALRRRRIGIDGHELIVAATFYSRRVAVDALDLDKARIINREYHTNYTQAEVFWASNVINTIRELDRKRIELNGDLMREEPEAK